MYLYAKPHTQLMLIRFALMPNIQPWPNINPRSNIHPNTQHPLSVHALGRWFRVPSRSRRVSLIHLYNSIVVRNIIWAPEKFEINTNVERETCGKYLVLGCCLIEYLLHEYHKRMASMFDTEQYWSMLLIFYPQMIL